MAGVWGAAVAASGRGVSGLAPCMLAAQELVELLHGVTLNHCLKLGRDRGRAVGGGLGAARGEGLLEAVGQADRGRV